MASKSFVIIRSYAVAAKINVSVQEPAASVVMKMTDFRAPVCDVKKEEFWMRDPNTGNWMPESQFNQIDVADLRDKLLPKKNRY